MDESTQSTPTGLEVGRKLSDVSPQEDILATFVGFGCIEEEIVFGDMKFGIRSLSPADEVYAYDRSGLEATTPVSQLLLTRVYIVCLMIRTINGQKIEEFFKEPEVQFRTDRDRTLVCNLLSPIFGQHWDRRAFRYFFRLLWAWSEVRYLGVVQSHGVEQFLTPEELELYRQIKDSEMVSTALGASNLQDIEDRLEDDDESSPGVLGADEVGG